MITDLKAVGQSAAVTFVDESRELRGMEYTQSVFADILVPADMTYANLIVDRSRILQHPDGHAVNVAFDIVVNGIEIDNGVFCDTTGGQVPKNYSLRIGITTGGGNLDVPPEMLNAAVGQELPLIGATGVLVAAGEKIEAGIPVTVQKVVIRPSIGTKEPLDLGAALKFEAIPIKPRQLLVDVHHSVAYDSVGAATSFAAASSKTWSHTNSGTTNLYLRIAAPFLTFPTVPSASTVTYDGVGLAMVGSKSQANPNGLVINAEIHELPNPSTGTKTASVVWAASANQYGAGMGSVMYTGVAQTPGSCSGTAVTATAADTAPTVNVASTTAGNMVGDCFARDNSNTGGGGKTATAGQTLRLVDAGVADAWGGGCQDAAAGGTITMGWTLSGTCTWVTVAAEILAAGGAGPVNSGRFFALF